MNKKALVLLSGGVDSTTCLAIAVTNYGAKNVTALSMYYGQKHSKELECANKVAEFYGVRHITKDISSVFTFSDCSLLQHSMKEIKHESYKEQLDEIGGEGTVETYVPFRNGLFLSYATAIAISLKVDKIFLGNHADDSAGRAYPDCSSEFSGAMNTAIYEGSGRLVSIVTPLLDLNKANVVKLGLSLGAPYELTWSCYEGGNMQCGKCGTCIDRRAAFRANGMEDPVPYEVQ